MFNIYLKYSKKLTKTNNTVVCSYSVGVAYSIFYKWILRFFKNDGVARRASVLKPSFSRILYVMIYIDTLYKYW